jgi:hypothetical protein
VTKGIIGRDGLGSLMQDRPKMEELSEKTWVQE